MVETKSAHVPKRYFRKTLKRIAANVRAVEEWAGEEVKVRGCLAIVGRRKSDTYTTDDVPIRACGQAELARMIREEAKNTQIDPACRRADLVQRVWKLTSQRGDRE